MYATDVMIPQSLVFLLQFFRGVCMGKDFDVIDVVGIPPVLYAEDLCRIFRCSGAKLDRILEAEYMRLEEESRNQTGNNETRGRFPLPLDTGGGKRQRRIWSRTAVENFLNSGEQREIKIETPTERKQRANAARQSLKEMGVKLDPKKVTDNSQSSG
jgi:hypothetical protein